GSMELSLPRWKPGQLLLGWAAYWTGLVGVTLSPAIAATWRATHLPDGHGSVSASFDNSTLNYTVIEDGVKTWMGTTSMATAVLWVVGPPLLLWLVWLTVRERPDSVRRPGAGGLPTAGALPEGSAAAQEWRMRPDDRAPVERRRVTTPNP
ncbi:MAG TPA: hypothetical protein VL308_08905, partial [Gemmatimonadaceae bacterium]|nr:hypothetical protein [Gemmatimonadaceae bacterium]